MAGVLRIALALVAGCMTAALCGLLPAGAGAAFPGTNGKIVFDSNRNGKAVDEGFQIFTMDGNGSFQTALTKFEGHEAQDASWSPDGKKIAFHRAPGGVGTEIFVMNADGSGLENLTKNSVSDFGPAWSPDGTKIAFYSSREGNQDIYVMDADGSNQTRLTESTASDQRPAWSPDGKLIAFESERDGNAEIYTMKPDGTEETNRTANPASDFAPTWSPDSQLILFSTGRDGGSSLYAMKPSGAEQESVITDASTATFSPDGTKIAFQRFIESNVEIFVADADGSNAENISKSPRQDSSPDWGVLDPCAEIQVGFAKTQGCFTEETPGSGIWTTEERAWVGGFEIVPRPGGKLVINTKDPSVTGSDLDVVFAGFPVPIPVEVLPVDTPSATVQIGGPGSILKVLEVPVETSAKIAWAKDGRSATYEQSLKLDKLSELIGPIAPGIGNVGGKLAAKLENGVGFVITQGEVKIDELALFPSALKLKRELKLRDLLLRFEEKEGRPFWTGQAGITLPLAKADLGITGRVFVVEGSLAGGGLTVTGINRRLGASPLFLQDVSGDLLFEPKFGYNLAIKGSLGPRIKGKQLLAIEGSMVGGGLGSPATCAFGPDPDRVVVSSKFTPLEPLIDAGLASTSMTLQSCIYPLAGAAMDVTGQMGFELAKGALAAESGYTGFVSPTGATIEGTGTIKIPLVPNLKGSLLASTVGLAACGSFGFFEGGFGYKWGGPPPAPFKGCDLGPYRAVAKASSAGATTSAAAVGVAVPKGLPHAAFAVRGTSAAPLVRLEDPDGVSIVTPAGGLLRNRRVVTVADRRSKTTYVIVRSPRPGTWRVSAVRGGIAGVEFARGLPDPKIRVRVLSAVGHGKGGGRRSALRRGARKLRLVYSVLPIPGQKVTFIERGEEIARTIGIAKRRRGAISLRPGAGTDASRTIEAEVVQDGMPRALLTVAKFRSAAPAAKPK